MEFERRAMTEIPFRDPKGLWPYVVVTSLMLVGGVLVIIRPITALTGFQSSGEASDQRPDRAVATVRETESTDRPR